MTKPKILVIGAGFTGCAVAHDLCLRGFQVIVLERGEIASGTSGRTHGLLHSGARYCMEDQEAAIECIQENTTLRKIAAQCIEFNRGYFVALDDEDLSYKEKFLDGAAKCKIPVEEIKPETALKAEPHLNPNIRAVLQIPDGVFDPLRLALAFAASAKIHGAEFRPYHEVENITISGNSNVQSVQIWNRTNGEHYSLNVDYVINATGAWAGKIAKLMGINVEVIPTPGIMVAFENRLIQHVINRLNMPGDGDILIPQRRMMVIGTTSFEVDDLDYIPIDKKQTQQMIQQATLMVPAVKNLKLRGVYMSARPLIGSSFKGRSLTRTFKCYDHQEMDGLGGLITITGGKATTCRLMAEKTADLVCSKLGLKIPCTTKDTILESYRKFYNE